MENQQGRGIIFGAGRDTKDAVIEYFNRCSPGFPIGDGCGEGAVRGIHWPEMGEAR